VVGTEERIEHALQKGSDEGSNVQSGVESISEEWHGNDYTEIETGATCTNTDTPRTRGMTHGIAEEWKRGRSRGTDPRRQTTRGKSWGKRPGASQLGFNKIHFYNSNPSPMSEQQSTSSSVLTSVMKGNIFRELAC